MAAGTAPNASRLTLEGHAIRGGLYLQLNSTFSSTQLQSAFGTMLFCTECNQVAVPKAVGHRHPEPVMRLAVQSQRMPCIEATTAANQHERNVVKSMRIAFSQFVQPGVPIWDQMLVIMPTALTITALSYTGFTALGALMGRAALGAVFNVWVRRIMASCFIIYGVLLGTSPAPLTGR